MSEQSKAVRRSCANCHYRPNDVCTAPIPASFRGIWLRGTPKNNGTDCRAHKFKVVRKAAVTAGVVA